MKSLAQEARQAMQERRYPAAIASYDEHLEQHPEDLRSLMEVGICHLLNGSEQAFLYIHRSMAAAIARKGPLHGKDGELWEYYLSLVAKVTATALVIGTASGCEAKESQPAFSGHRYSGGVQLAPKLADLAAAATNGPAGAATNAPAPGSVVSTNKPSGQPASTNKPRPVFSGHKYSGGAYLRVDPDLPFDSKAVQK